MTRRVALPTLVMLLALLVLSRCTGEKPKEPTPLPSDTRKPEPKVPDKRVKKILIDQILISFADAADTRFRNPRSKADAEALAKQLLGRLHAGVSFEQLKQAKSDARSKDTDIAERPFFVVNKGFVPEARRDGYGEVSYDAYFAVPRKLAFALELGEVGLAEYHKTGCPQGWFLIKRLR